MWSRKRNPQNNSVRALAPAKINLHLDVSGKRKDGYHDLFSLCQSVSLFDTLDIGSTLKKNICSIKGNFNFKEDQNIIKKAYNIFKEHTGVETGFEVKVEKKIPTGAGLGGGSSNAASALMSFFMLSGKAFSKSCKKKMAKALGSDVLFFLEATTALISGRGDIVKPVKSGLDYSVIIIYPGFSIDTSAAYGWLDNFSGECRSKSGINLCKIKKIYHMDSPSKWGFFNSFAEVLKERYSFYNEATGSLILSGAGYANVTGSGSCVFGIYEEKEKAVAFYNKYKDKYPFVIRAKPLDIMPLPVLQ